MSLRHAGQLSGSFKESSGCGSRMIFPLAVFFFASIEYAESGPARPGGYGEGNEDADVRAGALRRPSGSFRLLGPGMRRIVPDMRGLDQRRITQKRHDSNQIQLRCSSVIKMRLHG